MEAHDYNGGQERRREYLKKEKQGYKTAKDAVGQRTANAIRKAGNMKPTIATNSHLLQCNHSLLQFQVILLVSL